MHLCYTVDQLREPQTHWREAGARVALVPTMGSLHAGHLRLVEAARDIAEHVAASIFVNPLQFGPREDFASYPRQLEADARALADAGVALLFAPDEAQMYPEGRDQAARVEVPAELADTLCGAARPGHFSGVATVVASLLRIVQPAVAVFGEKDYQQLLVIRRMVADLGLPVEIVGVPTVRAADGLALSSRNAYLSPAQRAQAPALHQTLQVAAAQLQSGERDFAGLEQAGSIALRAAGMAPGYFSVRRLDDLAPPQAQDTRFAVLAAARLGEARLIDNVLVGREPV